jgi:arylsulfatase A-like enzyme
MKKNILFIFPDQLGARWLPTYGNPVIKTPNIEKLEETSVVFDNAYTNIPLCTPYRACLFTGKHPSENGVYKNGMCLPENTTTLADHLNDNGYDTHYIGKWHLSGDPQANRWVPHDQRGGFKNFIGWESHHVDHYKGLIWKDDPDTPIELKGHETDGLTDIVCE